MKTKILIICLIALSLRLMIIFLGYHGDLNNNISWGEQALAKGLNGFYEDKKWLYSAANQPPLTIILFLLTSWIYQQILDVSWWLNNNLSFFPSSFIWFWELKGKILLVKLPSIIADFVIAFLLFKASKLLNKEKYGLQIATLWLFNPVVWYNSSIWGQTDSVVNSLGLAAIYFLLKRNLVIFSILITLSLLFKGSLAIFIPVLFTVCLLQRHHILEWIKSIFAVLITVIAVSIWFRPNIDVFIWLIDLYNKRIFPGEISYLTANAFNFWWLVDSGKVYDNITILGLPARTWGFVISLGGVFGLLAWTRRHISNEKIIYSLALVGLLTFLFMTRIHERYLYPFFPYATLLLGLIPLSIVPYVIISLLHLINLYHLFWAPSIPQLETLFLNTHFANGIALLQIGILFWYIKLGIRLNKDSN